MNKRILFLSNDQDYLAEKFRINDHHIISVSKIALLKIQSWKFASKTPEIGSQYISSIEEIIRNSFFFLASIFLRFSASRASRNR